MTEELLGYVRAYVILSAAGFALAAISVLTLVIVMIVEAIQEKRRTK